MSTLIVILLLCLVGLCLAIALNLSTTTIYPYDDHETARLDFLADRRVEQIDSLRDQGMADMFDIALQARLNRRLHDDEEQP